MPTSAAAVISPLPMAHMCGGNHSETIRAPAGCIGALNRPAALRINKNAGHASTVTPSKPTEPVSATNVAEPNPIVTSAAFGPNRSMNQPPGVIAIVYVIRYAE